MGDWFDAAGNGSACDVQAMLDGKGGETLIECVASGALLSLGVTSDGGALGVTVTVDGRWRREYFRDAEALAVWAGDALDATQTAMAARPASPGARSRSRGTRAR